MARTFQRLCVLILHRLGKRCYNVRLPQSGLFIIFHNVPLSFTQLNDQFTSPPASTNHSTPLAITLSASKHQCQVTAWWGKSVSLGRSIVTLSRLTWASASTPSLATCRAYLDSWPSSKFAACGIQFAAFLHSHSFCASPNSSISVFYSYAQMEKRTNTPPILSRQGAIHPENMLGARGKQTLQPVLQGLVGLSWTGSWGPNSHCDHFDLVAWWLIVHHCTWVFLLLPWLSLKLYAALTVVHIM